MNFRSRAIQELAVLISDGRPIDWDEAERSLSSEGDRRLFAKLKALSDIADFQRTEGGDRPTGQWKRWGHLEILERIGEGAFADVFRARDCWLDHPVALKLLRRESKTPAAPQVVSEAHRLARVRHPNVVRIHGAEVREGRVGLWMELIEGQTLEDIVVDRGPMSPAEAVGIGIDLCRATAAVYAAGFLHCDLKARNVMRERGGRVVLMDFGIGRPFSGDGSAPACGTPLYMAPEVLAGERPSVRSEIYSLGVLLYFLLTGSYPITAQTVANIRMAHARREARLLGDTRPDLPGDLVEVIEKALSPRPDDRYRSPAEMEKGLRTAAGDEATDTSSGWLGSWASYAGIAGVILLIVLLLLFSERAIAPSPTGGYQVSATLGRNGPAGPEPLPSGSLVAPGDRLYLEFQSSEPVHVYVLDQDERGESYLLFPLPGFRTANPLPAGRKIRLPGERDGHELFWQVTSAGQKEHFLVIASPEPLTDFEKEIGRLAQPKAGAAVAWLSVPERALYRLRGVGGLAEAPSGLAEGKTNIFALAARLSPRAEMANGVWIRRIDLENPD